MDADEGPRLPPEEQAFFDELHALVEEVMLLRNGDLTEDDVRARLHRVFLRIHALPVRALATGTGAKLSVYLGGQLDGEGEPPDDGVA